MFTCDRELGTWVEIAILEQKSDPEQRNYPKQACGPSLDSIGQSQMPPVSPQPPSPEPVKC